MLFPNRRLTIGRIEGFGLVARRDNRLFRAARVIERSHGVSELSLFRLNSQTTSQNGVYRE